MAGVRTVRPFAEPTEYEAMIDYFLGADDESLLAMGVERAKLPARAAWLASALEDAARPLGRKERFFVGWRLDGELIGHSSISHIEYGQTAHCHLHLWPSALRRSGLGSALLADSIDLYFERFELQTLACEPYARNPGPNRTVAALGFQPVRRYRTVPTAITFEQEVQRYEVTRAAWASARGR